MALVDLAKFQCGHLGKEAWANYTLEYDVNTRMFFCRYMHVAV